MPINQTTVGTQTTSGCDRCVAMDDSGNYVAVWVSYSSSTAADIYMRLYKSDGTPLTAETLVNTYTTGNQTQCSVAMDADGDFVVVWCSAGQDPDGSSGIYGQRFNSVGLKVGSEFHINSTTANAQNVSVGGHRQLRQFRRRLGHSGAIAKLLQRHLRPVVR